MESAAAASPPSAPPPASKKATTTKATSVSPDAYTSLSSRMQVSKNVVDELLLVCGVIGTTEGDQFVPVTDCLNWLQDLQGLRLMKVVKRLI